MTVPKHVGSIIDTRGYEADVWFYPDDNHIFILCDTSQMGDFPVNEPCKADPQQVAADLVYREWLRTGRSQKLYIDPEDDDTVIEDLYSSFSAPSTIY